MCRILLIGLIVTNHLQPAAAIVTSDTSDRHIVTPDEPRFGINLDGVAIVGGVPTFGPPIVACTGALISDRHVLSAAHCFDEDGDGQLDSRMAPFPDAVIFELTSGIIAIPYQIDSVQVPGNWPEQNADIAIVTLDQAAPAEVPRYPLYGGTDEIGQPIVIAGYGSPGHGATGVRPDGDGQPSKRAGRNCYDALRDDQPGVRLLAYDFDSGLAEHNALALTGIVSDLGFGADEAMAAPGDSGGPAFFRGAIAGVAAFGSRLPAADVDEYANSSWGEANFDTRVSAFRDFLQTATNGEAVFVPEPSSGSLIGLAAATLMLYRACSMNETRWNSLCQGRKCVSTEKANDKALSTG